VSYLKHTDFLLASGSVIGRNHRNINVHKNNQDGFAIARCDSCTVAVVTDGCGSSSYSEVGALLGARLTAEAVLSEIERHGEERFAWHRVGQDLLDTYELLSTKMGGNFRANVDKYFLFTIIGVLLTDKQASFFAQGDGVVAINGRFTRIGPYPGNQPPYIGYGLMDGGGHNLTTLTSVPLEHLEHFLIGSDGVMDLVSSADKKAPGMEERVGDISQFWDERYFDASKPDLLNRRLRVIGRDWPKRNPEPGLLPDDTTLVVGRPHQTS
jgi:hypothetical protein